MNHLYRYCYQVTISIKTEFYPTYIEWAKEIHLQDILQRGGFQEVSIFSLPHEDTHTETRTVMLKYFYDDEAIQKKFLNELLPMIATEVKPFLKDNMVKTERVVLERLGSYTRK